MSEKKIQLSMRLLVGILLVIFVTVAVLTIHNHVLKKAFRQVQEAAYIHDAEELAEIARNSNPEVKIVLTGPEGLWDKNGMKSNLKLVRELTIGVVEGDTNKMFYRAGPVVADREGNIFVCEWRNGRIKKFDHEGNYLMTIGRKGLGPGEFSGALSLAFDNNNSLCVYDFGNQRLSKFSHDGRYIRSINLGADHIPAGLTLDASDKIYISAYDHKRENVILKYSADGELIISFGESVRFKKPIRFVDMTVKSNISAGPIALIDNEIYYSQRNPYEIRRFTTEGELKARIFRKNSFMPPSQIKIVRRETYQFRPPAMSVFITVWRDRIINWVWIPEYISLSTGSIIDLFDLNGHLLATLTIPDRVGVSYLDTQGKIYGIHRDREGIERVVRYVFKF